MGAELPAVDEEASDGIDDTGACKNQLVNYKSYLTNYYLLQRWWLQASQLEGEQYQLTVLWHHQKREGESKQMGKQKKWGPIKHH